MDFVVRMEDLDRVTSSRDHEAGQLHALELLGLDWDATVVRQSERFDRYDAAIEELHGLGRTYECFCTRREIREAVRAPQSPTAPDGAYPGTCRGLTDSDRAALRREGRLPALRLRADRAVIEIDDEIRGTFAGVVDDVVLRRNDGVPAYNLAVVVDDAAQGVAEVVRGDDLLSSTPRQVMLQRLLGLATPRYRHVPLVLGADGVRLAKRHGSVTLAQLSHKGIDASAVLSLIAESLGLCVIGESVGAAELIDRFDLRSLPRGPWVLAPDLQRSQP